MSEMILGICFRTIDNQNLIRDTAHKSRIGLCKMEAGHTGQLLLFECGALETKANTVRIHIPDVSITESSEYQTFTQLQSHGHVHFIGSHARKIAHITINYEHSHNPFCVEDPRSQ